MRRRRINKKTLLRNERRIYYFNCEKCGKKRQSFKRSRARKGVCRTCRNSHINENQQSLFEN